MEEEREKKKKKVKRKKKEEKKRKRGRRRKGHNHRIEENDGGKGGSNRGVVRAREVSLNKRIVHRGLKITEQHRYLVLNWQTCPEQVCRENWSSSKAQRGGNTNTLTITQR